MIQAKKKICSSCNQEKILWKSTPKLCKDCYFRMPENKRTIEKKPYVIPKQSEKRSKENRLYNAKRILYLTTHKECEAGLQGCDGQATDIHHLRWGADRSKYFLDETTFCAVCRACHHQIHDVLSTEELIKLGLRRL